LSSILYPQGQSPLAPFRATKYNRNVGASTPSSPRGPQLMSRLAIGLLFAVAAFLAMGGLRWLKTASGSAQPAPPEKPVRDAFAADRAPTTSSAVSFDQQRAMGYLKAICKIGPRISGTDGMKQQQEL